MAKAHQHIIVVVVARSVFPARETGVRKNYTMPCGLTEPKKVWPHTRGKQKDESWPFTGQIATKQPANFDRGLLLFIGTTEWSKVLNSPAK